jgi:hypothetical protein
MDRLYTELRIWRRRDAETAVLYRCWEDLKTGRFAVQSADFFKRPIDASQLQGSDVQFAELFIEVSPGERCLWFDSVEEAITAHHSEFS